MMTRFLFRFGFCTPKQWESNEKHDWDDESSEALFIEAETRDAALSWGCEVAESFSRFLFEAASWQSEIPSWKGARFSHWIEEDPRSVFPVEALERLPVVKVGLLPDFAYWVSDAESAVEEVPREA